MSRLLFTSSILGGYQESMDLLLSIHGISSVEAEFKGYCPAEYCQQH